MTGITLTVVIVDGLDQGGSMVTSTMDRWVDVIRTQSSREYTNLSTHRPQSKGRIEGRFPLVTTVGERVRGHIDGTGGMTTDSQRRSSMTFEGQSMARLFLSVVTSCNKVLAHYVFGCCTLALIISVILFNTEQFALYYNGS